jgi:hypothetical protein
MKKIIFIFLLAIGISLNGFAQPSEGDLEVGIGFGYNFSNVIHTEGIGGSMSGINFAGSFDYYFSNRWSLKGKIIYDQKGWNGIYEFYTYDDKFLNYLDFEQPYSINYITVPIMANWHFSKKRNWYLNFGPYIGFLQDAQNDLKGNSIEEELNDTDLGLAFGIGVKIPINDHLKFFFEADRQSGFTNIFNNYSSYDNFYNYDDIFGINLRGSFNFGLIYQISKSSAVQK